MTIEAIMTKNNLFILITNIRQSWKGSRTLV